MELDALDGYPCARVGPVLLPAGYKRPPHDDRKGEYKNGSQNNVMFHFDLRYFVVDEQIPKGGK